MKSTFAARLGELRQEQSMNQRQVANELGVSQAVLSHYENGLREPKLDFVSKVCAYYGVTADYILGLSDDRTNAATRLSAVVCDKLRKLEDVKQQEGQLLKELKDLCKQ
ncbi:MAG: helix-turn-helix domain-containing protein [Oscillospiraceae bacterium]|nr:helix-turn-helix domain-containing protein [Oscillospiraceae bacterium]MCL2280136.1 helix-turn-helix domain-containing protein [Oscillospiraceae bacterium]